MRNTVVFDNHLPDRIIGSSHFGAYITEAHELCARLETVVKLIKGCRKKNVPIGDSFREPEEDIQLDSIGWKLDKLNRMCR